MSVSIEVNGTRHDIEGDPSMPLLYALRNQIGLRGAKFGCGLGQCGACTVMVDGRAVFSCIMPVSALDGRAVTTTEGLLEDGKPGKVHQASSTSRRRNAATASRAWSCAHSIC